MSGHSKWATTKHKKAAIDAKRSSLFSKLSRNITVAAKLGGDPNPDNNATLAAAVARARMVSMPNAKIKAAIDKAFGSGADAANYAEITYEGYGPAGVAVYVDCLTDNKNRTAADVRSAFSHSGGSLGTSGSVAFQFERKGSIAVEKVIKSDDKKVADRENAVDEDEFMMAVAEAGGEDYEDAGEQWIVWTAYDKMQDVQKGLEAQGIEVKGSELTMVPTTPTDVSVADAKKVQRLVDRLDELEDVQNVYHTMNITDEIAEAWRPTVESSRAPSAPSPLAVAGAFIVAGSPGGRHPPPLALETLPSPRMKPQYIVSVIFTRYGVNRVQSQTERARHDMVSKHE